VVFLLCLFLGAVGIRLNHLGKLHPLYFRGNPAPGIVRLSVVAAMAWIAWVLWRHADPSVTGIYVVFYLIMGYAVVKLCGQAFAGLLGARSRVDVAERRNVAAALVAGAFTLSTGLIFGGSLWGEADPVGDGEGGFWIPLTFFFLGWGTLVVAFLLYMRGEEGRFAHRIQRERSVEDGRAAALFLLGAAVPLADAVAGDFWGWTHGLLTFGILASMVLVHEIFASRSRPEDTVARTDGDPPEEEPSRRGRSRTLEGALYLALGGLAWGLKRLLDALFVS
jgi:hypothetical protein